MNTEKVAERLQEIMNLADMHAHARIMPGTPRENLPYCILRALVQAALAEIETLRSGYAASRLEIESLQAQAQQCGAGAGCCAQAARIEALEAQIEAVGAGGVGRLVPDVSLINEGDMPAAQALDRVRAFWQQHTKSDALSMTMAELHDDAERAIRAARGAAQAAPSNGALAAPAQAVPAPGEPSEAPHAAVTTALLAAERESLQCDYCGAVTDDPWHSSGMLNGKLSKHIHSCDACAQDPTQQGGIP